MPIATVRRVTAAALVAATAVLVAANLLHPKEYGNGEELAQLAAIADAYGRWQAAHLMAFVAIVLFVPAVAGLAVILHRTQPARARWAGVLGILGLLGFAGAVTIDGFSWGVVGVVSGDDFPSLDDATAAQVLDTLQNSEWALPYYLLPAAWIASLLLFAVGLTRAGEIRAWAGGLLALGAVMVALEVFVGTNAYFVAASAVLAAGAVAVASQVHLARGERDDLAAGEPHA